MRDRLAVGDVAFYWRTKSTIDQPPTDIPARLPFDFSFDAALQLIIQSRDASVMDWLDRVYREDANVGYLQEGHALASSYGGEFLEFFDRATHARACPPRTIADIGCGGIYLLKKFQERGLSVVGIDPSPVTAESGQRAGIEIIPDFYPPPNFDRRFDIIYHYDVLEHVPDPVKFLREHHQHLEPGGGIMIAVPDCTLNIAFGDLSMILHEHLNYFDLDSLERTVRASGFSPILLERARHGGVLLCYALRSDEEPQQPVILETPKFDVFCMKARGALDRFRRAVEPVLNDPQRTLGIYVPIRALPYLSAVSSIDGVRLFDDDPGIHRRYYDGFNAEIENFQDLLLNPVTDLIVCSLAFGDRIAARVEAACPQQIKVIQWVNLFEQN